MSALIISVNGSTVPLEEGKTGTLNCEGKIMSDNFSVTFNSAGSFTYNGVTVVGEAGKKSGLNCAGKIMLTNIVVTASPYRGDGPLFPIEVTTEAEMMDILTNATTEDIGAIYKYIGETTDVYTNGELYIITEEAE